MRIEEFASRGVVGTTRFVVLAGLLLQQCAVIAAFGVRPHPAHRKPCTSGLERNSQTGRCYKKCVCPNGVAQGNAGPKGGCHGKLYFQNCKSCRPGYILRKDLVNTVPGQVNHQGICKSDCQRKIMCNVGRLGLQLSAESCILATSTFSKSTNNSLLNLLCSAGCIVGKATFDKWAKQMTSSSHARNDLFGGNFGLLDKLFSKPQSSACCPIDSKWTQHGQPGHVGTLALFRVFPDKAQCVGNSRSNASATRTSKHYARPP